MPHSAIQMHSVAIGERPRTIHVTSSSAANVNRSAHRSWLAACDDNQPLKRMSWEWMGTPAVPRLNESTLCDALNVLGARKSGTSDGVLIVGDSLAGQLYATLLGLFKGPRLCGGIARVDFRRNDFLTIGTGPQAAQQAVP